MVAAAVVAAVWSGMAAAGGVAGVVPGAGADVGAAEVTGVAGVVAVARAEWNAAAAEVVFAGVAVVAAAVTRRWRWYLLLLRWR